MIALPEDGEYCVYKDASHTYSFWGEQWPSVTGVVKAGGHLSHLPYSPSALSKGTGVHDWSVLIDQGPDQSRPDGGIEMDSVPDSMRGEVEGYAAFRAWAKPEWSMIETALWHPDLHFAGRPDRVGVLHGIGASGVIELKTGRHAGWHGLQLAGYQLLTLAGARHVLYLKPDGSFRFEQCEKASDYRQFRRDLSYAWENPDLWRE